MLGQTVRVLVTDRSRRGKDEMTGKCERNISVNFPGSLSDVGRILPVRITAASHTTLKGEKIGTA